MGSYAYSNEWQHARRRLAGIEDAYDLGTIRLLEERGVETGWDCLEVGAGGGTITAWLARRVGPSGHVLATDLDTRFLDIPGLPNLEVRRHDILTDDLPASSFDLVHTRAVLSHLPARERALARLVAALKPGGWLLVEDTELVVCPDDSGAESSAALFTKVTEARWRIMHARGFDRHYGRRLYGQLRVHGLIEVAAEGRAPVAHGGSPLAEWFRLSTQQVQDELIASGDVAEHEIGAYCALLESPAFTFIGTIMVAAWGRKPPQ